MMRHERLNIVVAGYMIRLPVAGSMLAYAHYLMGLERLGHRVSYVEESGWAQACYNPQEGVYSDDPRYGMRAVGALLRRIGVAAEVYYIDRQTERVYGGSREQVHLLLKESDVLLNVGGVCHLPAFDLCRRRALIDMDPMFTQVGRFAREGFEGYDAYFTYGGNVGGPGCRMPGRGVQWMATVPPVVGELWMDGERDDAERGLPRFTTIANWSAYGGVEYEGEYYGQKDEEFQRLIDLPKRVGVKLELAVTGMPRATAEAFGRAGWSIRSAAEVSGDLERYVGYVGGSAGEFSVAKNGYVRSRCGWISDRTVCYLAAGRPAVVQDTGVPGWIPTGEGMLVYEDVEGAAAALEEVCGDYGRHQRAAKRLVGDVFGYQVVLPRLLERIGGAVASSRGGIGAL
jgi:hypothetical protein